MPPERYEAVRFGPKTAGEIVREAVLELTYTAHDMAAFARDLGYVDEAGEVRPPFIWDEERRLKLRAKLDAVYFHLYGVTGRDDVRYIYSTFPIVEREETAAHGSLPFARAVPRLYERPCRGRPGCGDQVVIAHGGSVVAFMVKSSPSAPMLRPRLQISGVLRPARSGARPIR